MHPTRPYTLVRQNISGKVIKKSNIDKFTFFQSNYCLNVQSRLVIYTHISFKLFLFCHLGYYSPVQ